MCIYHTLLYKLQQKHKLQKERVMHKNFVVHSTEGQNIWKCSYAEATHH